MVKYTDYLSDKNTRQREDIEWSIFYSFNATDEKSPRVLTIGDSICYQYRDLLREKLSDKVNLTSWASAKCTNDVTFLKVEDSREALAYVSAQWFGNPAEDMTILLDFLQRMRSFPA